MGEINPGDQVLLRGHVTADGRCIVLAPGIELPARAVDVVAALPADTAGLPVGLVLFFASPVERQDFADSFAIPSSELWAA